MNSIVNFLLTFLFGERASGEWINLEYGVQAPHSTCEPDDQPDQYRWMEEHRVSSLHGVKQHVYL